MAVAGLGRPLGLDRKVATGGSSIGDIVTRLAPPSGQFLEADGRQLSKAMYPKLFAAIGDAFSAADFTAGFSAVTLSASSTWSAIAYGSGSTFVAISEAGLSSISTDNGATWVAGGALPAGTWRRIAYGAGLFVAMADASAICATSPDGVTWTPRAMPSTLSWRAVAYGGGKFVAIANSSAITAVSADGVTWASGGAVPNASWQSVTYGNGTFVAVATATNIMASSVNGGASWYSAGMPASAAWSSVAYGNGVFVAVASGTAAGATSTNGINWVTLTLSYASLAIAFGAGAFVAPMSALPNTYVTGSGSALGNNIPTPDFPYSSAAYGAGVFVMVKSGSNSAARASVFSSPNFNLPLVKPGDGRSTAYIKVA